MYHTPPCNLYNNYCIPFCTLCFHCFHLPHNIHSLQYISLIATSCLMLFHSTVVDCGRLDNPENGRVFITGTRVGSIATYRCNRGFRLLGSSRRTCQSNSQWSGQAPVCISESYYYLCVKIEIFAKSSNILVLLLKPTQPLLVDS